MKRVLSGIRATGRLHLGNYLGAVKGMLELQNNPEYETLYMVADVHTITTPYDVKELKTNRREVIIDYVAAGLDPEKSILFLQSDVNQHLELAFYLSAVETIARMQHLPTYKDKVKQHSQHNTMALLNYPILMAADILVYKAGLVPVGIDQEPHLEVAREIARKMNEKYGTDFPEPQRFKTKGEYIPSLTGEGKMSKSVEGSYLNLTDDLETIKSKVAKIPTDAGKGTIRIVGDKKIYVPFGSAGEVQIDNPFGVATLMKLIELFQGQDKVQELDKQYETVGLKYGEIKSSIAEAIYKDLEPIQAKRKELENNQEYITDVIEKGAEKARTIASQTVKEVREKMGLG